MWLEGQPDQPIVRTGASGGFAFPGLPPGSYTVRALGAGYRTSAPVPLSFGTVTGVPVTCDGGC